MNSTLKEPTEKEIRSIIISVRDIFRSSGFFVDADKFVIGPTEYQMTLELTRIECPPTFSGLREKIEGHLGVKYVRINGPVVGEKYIKIVISRGRK